MSKIFLLFFTLIFFSRKDPEVILKATGMSSAVPYPRGGPRYCGAKTSCFRCSLSMFSTHRTGQRKWTVLLPHYILGQFIVKQGQLEHVLLLLLPITMSTIYLFICNEILLIPKQIVDDIS